MIKKNNRQTGFLAFLIVGAFLVNGLPLRAQNVVTSEDFTGGSSAFVFKRAVKTTQRKVVSRSTVKRSKTAKVETAKRITKQAVTVAKVNPKRTKSKEVNPNTLERNSVAFKRKTAEETSVIFAGVGEYYLNTDSPDNSVDKAIEFFRESVLLDAKNNTAKFGLSEALTRKGDQLLNEQKYDVAKLLYEDAIRNNPKNAAAFAGIAEIFSSKDETNEAITNYEKALGLDTDLTELYAPLGVLYYQKGEIAKSETYLQKAIALDGNNAETQLFIGLVRFKQNRNDEAISAFKRSIELDPNNPETYYYLGEVYDRLDRDKDAIAAYRKAVELNPKYIEAWFDLGAAYYNRATSQGANSAYYEEAVKAYKVVTKLQPTNGEAHANLADVYRQMNRLDEAMSEYALAVTFIKDDAELYSNYGFVAGLRASNPTYRAFWKTSIENLEKAAALSPDYTVYNNLGWAYYNAAVSDLRDRREADYKAKLQKAKENLQKAIALSPKLAAPYLNLGMTFTDLGDFPSAIETLKRGIELEKNWLPAINELGIAYRKNGDFENASKQFRRAIEIDDNFAVAHYGLAESEFRRGNLKEAKKSYEKLKKLNRMDLVGTLEMVTNNQINR
jgi:superkiller protein 3